MIENNNDASIQLNTSSNRTSGTGQKCPVNIFIILNHLSIQNLSFFFSKNYHQNGQLVNVFQAVVPVKQVLFVK